MTMHEPVKKLDYERLQIGRDLPFGLTEEDVIETSEIRPNAFGRTLIALAQRDRNSRLRKQRFIDIYGPIIEGLQEKIGDDWSPERPEVAAWCLLTYASTVNRAATQTKLLDQFHRIFGLNSTTLKIRPDMPAPELVSKWKKELEARGPEYIQGLVGAGVTKAASEAKNGAVDSNG